MIQVTPRVRRSSDYLDNLLRRAYFALAMLCALGLVALPLLPIAQPGRSYTWLTLIVVTFLAAFVLMFHWRNRAPSVSGRGLPVRDPLTGLYTDAYWQHALNRRRRRLFRRPMPVTCLAIGVGGIARLRETHGQRAVDELLNRLGLELFRHVRPRDLGCRFGDQRLAVALMSCPVKLADRVGERIAHNIGGAVLGELAGDPRGLLQIRWAHVTFPDQAATPVQLLRKASDALDRQLFVRDRGPVESQLEHAR